MNVESEVRVGLYQVVFGLGHIGVIRAQFGLVDLQGPLVVVLHLFIFALVLTQQGQIIQLLGNIRVVLPQHLTHQNQHTPSYSAALDIISLTLIEAVYTHPQITRLFSWLDLLVNIATLKGHSTLFCTPLRWFSIVFLCKHALDGCVWPHLLQCLAHDTAL